MIFGSKKHKIVKENKYAGIEILDSPKPEDILKINRVVIFRPKQINAILSLFTTIISDYVDEERLKKIREKIASIDYEEKESERNVYAEYCLDKNSITLNNKHGSIITVNNDSTRVFKMIKNIFHETFHAISGHKTENSKYVGFRQGNIGVGINEGFTELMAREFASIVVEKIKSNEEDYDFIKSYNYDTDSYTYERIVATIVSDIIGKEKMFELYINADLKGLINELAKYSSQEKTIKFIDDLDYITKIRFGKNNDDNVLRDEKINDIFIYLNKLVFHRGISEPIDKDTGNAILNNLNLINSAKKNNKIR